MKTGKIGVWTKKMRGLLESKDISTLLLAYYLLSNKEDFTTWVNANVYLARNGSAPRGNIPKKNHLSVGLNFGRHGISVHVHSNSGLMVCYNKLKEEHDNTLE